MRTELREKQKEAIWGSASARLGSTRIHRGPFGPHLSNCRGILVINLKGGSLLKLVEKATRPELNDHRLKCSLLCLGKSKLCSHGRQVRLHQIHLRCRKLSLLVRDCVTCR